MSKAGRRPRPEPEARFFATAAKGTEVALRNELRRLRFHGVRADRGGVHFEGDATDGFRACIELRTAVRVLLLLGTFPAPNGDALYEGVRAVDWTPFVDERRTLVVRSVTKSSRLTHTQFVSQRTKDAIVDGFRERVSARPSVDKEDPDLSVFVRVANDEATVYADLSGRSLHERGYRKLQLAAPLKETLAASLLELAEHPTTSDFLDPMCGSGTIAIEAAMRSFDVAPGSLGPGFGFERWPSFDASKREAMRELLARARARKRSEGPVILARDTSPEALAFTRENAKRAGVAVRTELGDVVKLERMSPPPFVLTNPPYGERLETDVVAARAMGRGLARLGGSTVAVLCGAPEVLHAIPMRPDVTFPVMNGDLECRLAIFHPAIV
jgi:putative N6-adenine-specific DNA methylase